jgi:hypothetical protein
MNPPHNWVLWVAASAATSSPDGVKGFSPWRPIDFIWRFIYEMASSQISNLKFQIPNFKSPIPNLKFQTSNFKFRNSNLESLTSHLKSQIPNFKSPISIFKYSMPFPRPLAPSIATLSRARQCFFRACRLAGHAHSRKHQRARENTAISLDPLSDRLSPIMSTLQTLPNHFQIPQRFLPDSVY